MAALAALSRTPRRIYNRGYLIPILRKAALNEGLDPRAPQVFWLGARIELGSRPQIKDSPSHS